MKKLDYFLQNERFKKAIAFIPKNAMVLDIGCSDGAIFSHIPHLKYGVGIDPKLKVKIVKSNYTLLPGHFSEALKKEQYQQFDAITLLAVIEHIPINQLKKISGIIHKFLKKNGKVIITVPHPFVDKILDGLRFFRLIDGMELEEHYGYEITQTEKIFTSESLKLNHHKKFQFGLNNLFVFEKVN